MTNVTLALQIKSFYDKEDLEITFNTFINKLNNYNPRKYILENLTFEICENKLINLINTIY